jgi:protein-disulfide isomerase
VTFVVFEDPLCPHCRVLTNMLFKLLKTKSNFKVYIHLWAFLKDESGKIDSEKITRYICAAYKVAKDPQTFLKFYEAVTANEKEPTDEVIKGLVVGAKIDFDKVKEIAESDDAKKYVEEKRKLAATLKFPGAPIFMAVTPDGSLGIVPPLNEQGLGKLIEDLSRPMPQTKAAPTTAVPGIEVPTAPKTKAAK